VFYSHALTPAYVSRVATNLPHNLQPMKHLLISFLQNAFNCIVTGNYNKGLVNKKLQQESHYSE